MTALDPRLNAFRPDLADAALRGQVEAGSFASGTARQVVRGAADLRRRPAADAPLDTQLLHGEPVTLFDEADGWAWVQSRQDGYVGYVETAALGPVFAAPTHRVTALRTFLYPEPDLKAPPIDCLSLATLIEVCGAPQGEGGRYSEVAHGPDGSAWVYSAHLTSLQDAEPDYTATVLRFLGVPYLWGGRTSLGLDCSALVQLALACAGIACPRDTYVQAAALGQALEGDPARHKPQYGDIIYMPGHVAIALDAVRVVHANAWHMLVAVEPLADLLARVAKESGRDSSKVIDVIRRPA